MAPASLLLALLLVFTASQSLRAQNSVVSVAELKKLTIEQLSQIEVTSASRREEPLARTASAVAVITSEDIRRAGVTSVPEALRMAPGLHVARHTASTWAVAARGFSSVNSEKLLVLSDTRSIYTPLFSGVFWDAQDYLLQDIERIEVIRGPGAALWGSNAVNGVINITTKHARDTQGLYADTMAGSSRSGVGARYGGRIGDNAYYRVFGKYFDRGNTFHPTAAAIGRSDDWQMGHLGFRADWDATDADSVTLQGDLYDGEAGQLSPTLTIIGREGPGGPLDVFVSGGNLLGRWRRDVDERTSMQLRAYYDRTQRDDPTFRDELHTADIDFQYRFQPQARHDVLWGLNYRLTSGTTRGLGIFAPGFDPSHVRDHVVGAFVQDQVAMLDTLELTVGTKLEHNSFSGFEAQPSGRARWDVTPDHSIWAAVSRAVRVPTRYERDVSIDVDEPAPGIALRVQGNEAFDAERMMAYEAGYRWQAHESLFVDVAAFYNRYAGLASLELGDPIVEPDSGRTVVPIVHRNLTDGHARGLEALVRFTPVLRWRLTATSSLYGLSLHPRGADLNRGRFIEGATPRHQLGVRSFLDLPAQFQIDVMFRHLTTIRHDPDSVTGEGLPGYAEMDVRLSWRGWRQLEISIAGQNLLHDRHVEFGIPEERGQIERAAYVRAAWGF